MDVRGRSQALRRELVKLAYLAACSRYGTPHRSDQNRKEASTKLYYAQAACCLAPNVKAALDLALEKGRPRLIRRKAVAITSRGSVVHASFRRAIHLLPDFSRAHTRCHSPSLPLRGRGELLYWRV